MAVIVQVRRRWRRMARTETAGGGDTIKIGRTRFDAAVDAVVPWSRLLACLPRGASRSPRVRDDEDRKISEREKRKTTKKQKPKIGCHNTGRLWTGRDAKLMVQQRGLRVLD